MRVMELMHRAKLSACGVHCTMLSVYHPADIGRVALSAELFMPRLILLYDAQTVLALADFA
jgi:hypothetical protein